MENRLKNKDFNRELEITKNYKIIQNHNYKIIEITKKTYKNMKIRAHWMRLNTIGRRIRKPEIEKIEYI